MNTPPVLPTVFVDVDETGTLKVRVDAEAYPCPSGAVRADLASLVNEIAAARQTPVRVEIHEADGTSYTDIAVPPIDEPSTQSGAPIPALPSGSATLTEPGYNPGEEVVVAFRLGRARANPDGCVELRLPPAIMARHHDDLLVVRASTLTGQGIGT